MIVALEDFKVIIADSSPVDDPKSKRTGKSIDKEAEEARKAEVLKQVETIKKNHSGTYPIDISAIQSEHNALLRDAILSAEIDSARWKISERITEYLSEKGFPKVALANDCGVDAGQFARALKTRFSMPPDALAVFCYKYYRKTAQELMFGAPRPTPLPRYLEKFAVLLNDLREKDQYSLCSLYVSCADIFKEDNAAAKPIVTGGSPSGTAISILRNRLIELADGVYMLPVDATKNFLSSNTRVTIQKLLNDGENNYIGSIFFMMKLAVEYDTTLDYFLVQDYTALGDVCAHMDGQEVLITDQYVKAILGMVLLMSEPKRNEFLSRAWYTLQLKFPVKS